MNLVIDIGNTLTKLAIFQDEEIVHKEVLEDFTSDTLESIRNSFPGINKAILSTVKNREPILLQHLSQSFEYFLELDHTTPLPITNKYETPVTLGYDRLAAVVGANTIFPNSNVLIIDIGSAITFDFIDLENNYQGGNISPGLNMRFRALHEFTSNLPLVQPSGQDSGIGKNTTEAIRKGVQNGIVNEVNGFIDHMISEYKDLKIIVTGGDSNFFDNSLKNSIFVDLNLILKGLNCILEHNA
ncbi:MAG: type III pantothenate kinase [Bacteroidales bacterium]|nr:type III pantothenate kinase [Bacteroidales bacterium]